MKLNALLFLVYGILILVGGMIGYASAHSLASLLMGSLFAVLLILSAFAIQKGYLLGYFCGRVLTVTLTMFFAYRFLTTFKFMPAGMMTLLSFCVLIASLAQKQKAPDQTS